MRIELHEAIEQLIEAYREWLDESQDNVTDQWRHFFEEDADVEGEFLITE